MDSLTEIHNLSEPLRTFAKRIVFLAKDEERERLRGILLDDIKRLTKRDDLNGENEFAKDPNAYISVKISTIKRIMGWEN